ncbi:Hypothetical predicted protein [Lecanosticta acicola]|uniref:Thymidylate kinase n=1 Tax=Lecanosticta acicola TaxID=111012 RepID=A0AAI9E7M0_9PEZI|nr:Hypothetical predicted protein [Lecanosticta acicola]
MAAHAPVARVPFAPLDNPRLQHLASAKNRQSGLVSHKSTGKPSGIAKVSTSTTAGKRSYEPSFDFDSENVDPAMFDSSPSKKSKSDVKPFTFSLSTPIKSMPPPPMRTPMRAKIGSPRAPSTAPAGRSPKRKLAGSRRISAPFTRVDPPSRMASVLPFSLDAALSSSFPSSKQSCMPKNWFFEIYEDSPEEEAANLMEHSTLTLDISSDEEGGKKDREERGKENTPPEGYDVPLLRESEVVRTKKVCEEMDDGERSPLSDLEAEPFFAEGLSKESCVVVDEEKPSLESRVVDGEKEKPFAASAGEESKVVVEKEKLFAAPAVEESKVVVGEKGDVKGEIIVWEDA